MPPDLSIIIVSYNSGLLLEKCIDSLIASQLNLEIIVVDNASADNSLENIRRLSSVTLIQNTHNLGFARACNQGAHEASGDFILFLNPDCQLRQGTLALLLQCVRQYPDAALVGGRLIDPDGREQGGGRRAVPTPWRSLVRAVGLSSFSKRWPRLFDDFHLHKQPLPASAIELEAVSGACMLIRREALEQVNFWDEGYFLHCEDLDLCMSMRRMGWKIFFEPNAIIVHEKGGCSKKRPYFVEWHKHKGMIRFYNKFFRHQYPGALMWLVFLGVWLHFAAICLYHFTHRLTNQLQNLFPKQTRNGKRD